MSSAFRKSSSLPRSCDVLVVGHEPWVSPLASALTEHSLKTSSLVLAEPVSAAPLPVHVGNGEKREKARLIFGESLAERVFSFSEANLAKAQKLSKAQQGSLLWMAEKRVEAQEACVNFPHPEKKHELCQRILHLDRLDRSRPLQIGVEYEISGKREKVESTIVVLASEILAAQWFPWARDKFVSVTLSSFTCERLGGENCRLALFNQGAEFAFATEHGWRVGSYRNLFQDRAVGIHKSPDPVSQTHVIKFFSDLGWVASGTPLETHLSYEALSCDGLPVVGAIPEAPNVYVVGGFGARAQNFIFEVAHELAKGISAKTHFERLEIFSTRRFT